MKKLLIIAAMVTLLTNILGQGNQAKAQSVTGKIVYVISVKKDTGQVMVGIRGDNMATNFIRQGLFETNVKVGDYFRVERQNTPYNGTLNWQTGNVLQVVNSGNGSAVFRAIVPGTAMLSITPEGRSDPLTIQVIVSQSQAQPGPVATPAPVPATQGQDPTLELQKQGIEYRKKKLFTQAIQSFNQGLEMNPRHAWLYFQRGITHSQMKNPDLAISDFNQAIAINPNVPKVAEIYFLRGCTYGFQKQQYDAALKDINQALKLNPDANKYYWRGRIYENKGQYFPAISDFEQAIKLAPSDPRAYFSKASSLDKSGQQKEAIEAYQVYLRYAKDPKSIQRANERISELKEELKPLVKKVKPAAKPVAKKPPAQAETEHFSGPLGEEAF